MVYQKCGNCGHFNESKSEFQIFCDSCGQKLDPNFTNWKKQNYRKTFEDFQKQYCVTHDQKIREQTPTTKKKSKMPRGLIIVLIIVLVFSAVGTVGYFVYPYVKDKVVAVISSNQDAILQELAKRDWNTYTSAGGLKLDAPLPLVSAGDMAAQAVENPQVDYMEVLASGQNPIINLEIALTYILFTEGVEYSVEAGLQGVVANIEKLTGTKITTTDTGYNINDYQGLLSKSAMVYKGKNMDLNVLILNKERKTYVVTIFSESGEGGKGLAEKILKSVKVGA